MSKTPAKIGLKTPISYYGGKQSMLKHILPLIPEHRVYCEPFFGGGAVFWGKRPSEVEIINDYNGNVITFYRELKTNFTELKLMVDATPFSRDVYKNAMTIYNCPYLFSSVHRAWAFWVGTVQGFSNKIGSWRSSSITSKESNMCFNKRESFDVNLSRRLDLTQIEHMDAVELIKRCDCPEAFFYIDPPYVNSNQGHYGGYTQENFNTLLDVLSTLKGKFLLSSYPNDTLQEYRDRHEWYSSDKNMPLSASSLPTSRKTEAMTANYPI